VEVLEDTSHRKKYLLVTANDISFDAYLLRTMSYTTARIWAFGYFYDKFNPDPRRMARIDFFLYAGILGGATAGFLTNPIDIVFNRMQVDELYP
jgi:hypothetical protein